MSSEDAKRIYNAFRAAAPTNRAGLPIDADGVVLPDLEKLQDGGAGWFAVVNNVEQLAAPPTDARETYEMPITEIEPRRDDDGEIIIESSEERPASLTIRPRVADDLCVPGYGSGVFENGALARMLGLPIETLEWRLDPADTEAARVLMIQADGTEAAEVCAKIYEDGGGTQALTIFAFYDAWRHAARATLTTYHDDHALVRCRTHGAGTLKVGPLRSGHLRIYQETALRATEWDGRLDALAMATGRDTRLMRVEDVMNLWAAFDVLKKKVEDRRNSIVESMLSATSSTDDTKTSTT